MNLASIRLVTNDVDGLTAFYQRLTGVAPQRPNPAFASFAVGAASLAISSEDMIRRFNAGAAVAAANRSALVEFEVEDVEAVRSRLGDEVDCAMEPTDMPWGNRSMLLRDPDGNVVNVFRRPRG